VKAGVRHRPAAQSGLLVKNEIHQPESTAGLSGPAVTNAGLPALRLWIGAPVGDLPKDQSNRSTVPVGSERKTHEVGRPEPEATHRDPGAGRFAPFREIAYPLISGLPQRSSLVVSNIALLRSGMLVKEMPLAARGELHRDVHSPIISSSGPLLTNGLQAFDRIDGADPVFPASPIENLPNISPPLIQCRQPMASEPWSTEQS